MHPAQTRDTARHRAALIHLVASISLVGAILAVPLFVWYPGALRPLSGIDRHLLLLFAVVLAVGPALTWLVFRTGKRGLRMNMVVIALIQLAFLGYASAMLARLRPVYLVGMDHHFELVRAVDIDRADLASAVESRRALSWTGPVLVGSLPPAGTFFGIDEFARRPAYYIEYAQLGPLLAQRGVHPDDAISRNTARASDLEQALASQGRQADSVRLVPLVSAAGRAAMLVDASNGQPLKAIAVSL